MEHETTRGLGLYIEFNSNHNHQYFDSPLNTAHKPTLEWSHDNPYNTIKQRHGSLCPLMYNSPDISRGLMVTTLVYILGQPMKATLREIIFSYFM